LHTDRCISAIREECNTKEAEKKLKYKRLCIEIQRMWNEVLCDTSSQWSHRNSNQRSEKISRSLEEIPGKHSTDSLQKNYHPGNIAHTKESNTTRSLKPEWRGAPLVQGKEHQEKPVLTLYGPAI
jgi:hypothetical protein